MKSAEKILAELVHEAQAEADCWYDVLDLRTFPAEGDYESNPDIRNHLAVRYMWNKDHWNEFSKTFENLEYFFRSVEDCFVLRAEIAQLRDSMVPVRRLPRETRPSAPFRLTTPVPDAISVPKPVP